MVDDTLDVTAVAASGEAAVAFLDHSICRIVRRVAVGESVREYQIDHVCRGEALA